MKKIILALLALSMLTLTGCGEKQKETKKTVIRFSWWGGSTRHEATLKAIEQFEKKYPNIDVKAEYGGWTGYNEKLVTQFIGNSAADLVQVNWNILFELGADKFLDLKNGDIDLSNYPESILKQVKVNDKVLAVPLGMSGKVFYYQKNLYDKAGVPIPESFADLFKAAKIFKEKLGKDYYPFFLGDGNAFYMVLYYAEQITGKTFIKDNKVNYTNDELTKGFEFYLKMVKEGVVPTIAETQASGVVPVDQNPKWINGYYGGIYEWDTGGGKIKNSVKEGTEIVVGKTPVDYGKPSLLNKISMTWAVNAKTKHKKETELLINYLLTNEDGVKSLGIQRGIPINKKAVEILEKNKLLKGIQYTGHKIVQKDAGLGISPYLETKELQQFFKNTMQEVGVTIDAKKAAEKIINTVDTYLEKESK